MSVYIHLRNISLSAYVYRFQSICIRVVYLSVHICVIVYPSLTTAFSIVAIATPLQCGRPERFDLLFLKLLHMHSFSISLNASMYECRFICIDVVYHLMHICVSVSLYTFMKYILECICASISVYMHSFVYHPMHICVSVSSRP